MRLQPRPVPCGKSPSTIRRAAAAYAVELLEPRLLLSSQAYVWQNAQIGAGGFVDGIFYSPTQQNVIYARTDIGGLYKSTNDGQSWQELLDFVGNNTADSGNSTQSQEIGVLSFAIDPENPNNLDALVGEYTGTDGDVLYSTDAGATWSQTALSFYVGGNENGRADGERIAVDPNDSNIVFFGSNANGLWESTNAGHSFSQVTSFPSGPAADGISFVLFNPSGTAGHASQTIYVGVTSTDAGTNLYATTNGGSSWTEITGTGAAPTGFMPNRAALASDGNLYLAYSNALAPTGNLTDGAVMRYNTANGLWTNISPDMPGITFGSNDTFGYVGIALDPESSTTVVVTSFDRYNFTDQIWRTTDANANSPTWTALYDNSSAQNYGYGGFDDTRNTSNAPWVAAFGDGIGNWAGSVAINPFNSAQIMYGTGQGIWATNHGTSATPLTAANSWYFPDNGIEFTAVVDLAAPPSGVPLLSAIGDINGFDHTTLTSSPAAGGIASSITNGATGTMTSIDFAEQYPNYQVIVGNVGSDRGAYTYDGGITWTEFASRPSGASGGSIAVAADASTIVWAPSGEMPYFSNGSGAAWTQSTLPGGAAAGGTVVADRINPNYFYYWTENGSDNSWTLYISNDGGQTFTESAGGPLGIGNVTLVANPYVAGDLWLSTYIGVYHSIDFGASFTHNSVIGFNNVSSMALGAPAPGTSQAAIYIYGLIGSFEGVYRSDDGGATWTLLNDVSHQWGGVIDTMAADPNVFGRVYLGVNGRGVIVGNPASTLPANWSDANINTPGNPGWATSTTTLSTGSVVNQWTISGGGAGIQGTSDQFNFASEPLTGGVAVSAELTGLTNADGNDEIPQAGVMIRGGTDSNDPFVAMVQTSDDTLTLEYRAATGGTRASYSVSGISIGAEYVELVRLGNKFSGYYSSDGVNWTQLGTTVTISAMPATADVGLAATASDNQQLTGATFTNLTVNTGPTVATAAASPNPAPGSTTALSVLGSENGSGSGLTYTWSATGPGSVTYSGAVNGSNDARNITAMFSKAGSYTLTATITDSAGLTASSSVVVVNSPVPTALAIVSQPTAAATGATLLSPIIVVVEDTGGVIVDTASSSVHLQLLSGPTGGALAGVTTRAAVNGRAVFSNLAFTLPGVYTLQATSASLTSASTGPIVVVDEPVHPYLFNSAPLSPAALAFQQQRELKGIAVVSLVAAPGADALAVAFAAAPPTSALSPQIQPPFDGNPKPGADDAVLSAND
jgi:xyloglucan-specific exo-beta-1,4-glucanase